jgi:single-stranded-DNA-specific exonuclease
MEHIGRKWKMLPGISGKAPKIDLPGWLLNILSNRGIKTEAEIKEYLEPEYGRLLEYGSFLNMSGAVARIKAAKDKGEKVTVYGDYDVDGITSTALMYEVLSKIGIQNVETYIPHREDEGYGLNNEAIDEIAGTGTSLIVAVDCYCKRADCIRQEEKNRCPGV